MQVVRWGIASYAEAQKEANSMGLSGYIVNGPDAEGKYSIKVMTMPPTQQGLQPETAPPPPQAPEENDDHVDRMVDSLLARRRSACYCAPYRKPCSTCDAYWDGLVEMADALSKDDG
jgi:hypothetical protein